MEQNELVVKEATAAEIPPFFSVTELVFILGISRTTAYALVNTKGFPCGRIGTRIVIEREQFLKWVEKHFNNRPIPLRKYHGERRSA